MILDYDSALELSKPTLQGFSPHVIPWQNEVIKCLRHWDYKHSTPEILCSGTFGSAKSVLLAHIIVIHCLKHKRARIAIGRRALPDLKRTLYEEIIEHIEDDLIEGRDYWKADTIGKIVFKNGSEIIGVSWADKRYKKFRSLKLSGLVITEIVENSEEDKEAFMQLKGRVRRLPHIPVGNFVLADTNPDSPEHWVYKYWIASKHPNRPVFYSNLRDNPFLSPAYLRQLEEDLDPKSADRYINGIWCDVTTKRIYYCYDKEKNFIDKHYKVDEQYPIYLSWDFNIADKKPMSAIAAQYKPNHAGVWEFHIFNETVVEGMRTEQSCDELAAKGILDYKTRYEVHGDAAGRAKDTRTNKSDYDLIEKFLSNYRVQDGSDSGRPINFEMKQPLSNPPVRTRHIKVNTYLKNSLGDIRIFIYVDAPTVDEGLRLTKLKKGGLYVEDDTIRSQHVTTALGYMVCRVISNEKRPEQHTKFL